MPEVELVKRLVVPGHSLAMVYVCRKKHAAVNRMLQELGEEILQERLEEAAQMPAMPPHRLATLVQVSYTSFVGVNILCFVLACAVADSIILQIKISGAPGRNEMLA